MNEPDRYPRPHAAGIATFAIFFIISGFTGDFFPFTQVPMYSGVGVQGARRTAAIPVFLADGQQADIRSFERFTGPPPRDMMPWAGCRANGKCYPLPCSMSFIPEDDARWVTDHTDPAGAAGPVHAAYAYLMLEDDGDGGYRRSLDIMWEGTAWPR
ncbi:MAG TPA: hypothetical protein PKA64_07900 [Myxococcota bacterium]|nr:hypothetical protein [Myxococcota bacterium]